MGETSVILPTIPVISNLRAPELVDSEVDKTKLIRATKQKYLPFTVMDAVTIRTKFNQELKLIEDIVYEVPNFSVTDNNISTISKLTEIICRKFCGIGYGGNGLAKTYFTFNGVNYNIFVSHGNLFDNNGNLLASLAIHKNFLTELNEDPEGPLEALGRIRKIFTLITPAENRKKIEFLNNFGILLITKEFAEERKYRNLYSKFFSNFVGNSSGLNLDYQITDHIEKSVYRLSSPVFKTYSSMREKVEFQKEVWNKVVT